MQLVEDVLAPAIMQALVEAYQAGRVQSDAASVWERRRRRGQWV